MLICKHYMALDGSEYPPVNSLRASLASVELVKGIYTGPAPSPSHGSAVLGPWLDSITVHLFCAFPGQEGAMGSRM